MKLFALLISGILVSVTGVRGDARAESQMKCLMEKPMVTGASISDGLDGINFAVQLAEKYHTLKNLIDEAYSGTTGETIASYRSFSENLKNASIVLALDFFYWDQLQCGSPDWDANFNKTVEFLFKRSVGKGIPLVIGTLGRGQEPFTRIKYDPVCGKTINEKVKTLCGKDPKKCLLIDSSEMAKFVFSYFQPKLEAVPTKEKSQYFKAHVTRDAIHPRTSAYAAMSEYLDQTLQTSALQCK